MTATEARRSFTALLDDAEQGDTVIVTRGGRRVASIGPTPAGNGEALLSFLNFANVDVDFAADVHAAREAVTAGIPAWPGTVSLK